MTIILQTLCGKSITATIPFGRTGWSRDITPAGVRQVTDTTITLPHLYPFYCHYCSCCILAVQGTPYRGVEHIRLVVLCELAAQPLGNILQLHVFQQHRHVVGPYEINLGYCSSIHSSIIYTVVLMIMVVEIIMSTFQ